MQAVALPNTDLTVSRLCFGCWGIVTDFHWGERSAENSEAAILAAVDAGVNFFDTATVYGDGASESLLGEVFAKHGLRQKTVIASKVPPTQMSPAGIQAECEASLQRLQTDYLDLYQTHWADRDVPLAESWGAMQRLQEQGKVRHIGVCNMGVGDLDAVCPIQSPATNQLPYNLLWRMIEAAILPRCAEREMGVLVYSPLMHGMLADKYQTADQVPDGRARSRHFSTDRSLARHGEPGCEAETFAALARIRSISASLGRTMADVSLAWATQGQGVVSVIAGVSSPEQLADNVATIDNPLLADTIAELNVATQPLAAALGTNPDMWDGGENARYR